MERTCKSALTCVYGLTGEVALDALGRLQLFVHSILGSSTKSGANIKKTEKHDI